MTLPHPAERERLRSALIRAVDVFVSREATAEDLAAWAGVVEDFAHRLEERPPESLLWGVGSRGMFAVKGMLAANGFESPPALAGDTLTATVVFGPDQEGHRGLAHGGSIAQAFDYLCGMFEGASGRRPYTSELTVRFLRPVPVGARVALEARIESVDAARRTVSARALIDGRLHAECDAVLVMKQVQPQ